MEWGNEHTWTALGTGLTVAGGTLGYFTKGLLGIIALQTARLVDGLLKSFNAWLAQNLAGHTVTQQKVADADQHAEARHAEVLDRMKTVCRADCPPRPAAAPRLAILELDRKAG